MSKEWKLVPVEPTDEMKEAGAPSCEYTGTVCAALCYEAMIAVAPMPPQADTQPAAYISASVLEHLLSGGDAGWQWIGPLPCGSDQVGLYTRSDAGEVERLREELTDTREAFLNQSARLVGAEQRNATLETALKFYADGDHLLLADPDEWDTCSGEPINWLHDAAGTASVEDGSVAKQALTKPTESGASE